MTLDEWKNLQEQTRPKPEFNIRKPESTVPSKAVVIHKSKYRDDVPCSSDGFPMLVQQLCAPCLTADVTEDEPPNCLAAQSGDATVASML
ncbi:hypothetical protein P7K49_000636 [Saguinus oedipus]|uniref:Hyaluronan/mRNA-binding protein domain-containing protein n=1 Tax=Saguinus oedipus TaxID=9490 RepID=A0ABQ9WCT4_SAGOE|nr:hypothetical protein P7K49_000636 [Saguinus oedipus]